MSFSSIKNDPARVAKELQQSTGAGRYILDAPGPGDRVGFLEDPFMRLQKHGANLRTNTLNIESDLFGLTRTLVGNDNIDRNDYKKHEVKSESIECGSQIPTTEQSRAIMPVWTARDLEQVNWATHHLDPQEHVCMQFQNNLSTRILEKDNFVPHIPVEEHFDDLFPKGDLIPKH
tara:strand:- start:405 stop:929 length:525 start_codon:yes stop_codon:yes gene_type:complete